MSDDHWHRPLIHVRAGELSGDTGQTSGMTRREAISGKSAGSEKLWMGQTHVAAGREVRRPPSRRGRDRDLRGVRHPGVRLRRRATRRSGWRPSRATTSSSRPYVPHREENPGADEAVVVIARSSQEGIVVNLPSLWPAES